MKISRGRIFDTFILYRGRTALILAFFLSRHLVMVRWQCGYLYSLLFFMTLFLLIDNICAAVIKKGMIRGDRVLLPSLILIAGCHFTENIAVLNLMTVFLSFLFLYRDAVYGVRMRGRNLFRERTASAKCVVLNGTSVIIEYGDGIRYVDGKSEYLEIITAARDAVNGCLADLDLYVDRYVKKQKNPDMTRFVHLKGDETGNVLVIERDVIDRGMFEEIENYEKKNGFFEKNE